MHLILAMQRPGNHVREEMRANLQFRICLRVQSPEDSRDMLNRTEAANLKGASAGVLAVATIWKKLLRPLAHLVTTLDDLTPLLKELHKQLGETPQAWSILREIVAQVRSDSGSTLKDMVTELRDAAKENRVTARVLAADVAAVKELSARDRADSAADRAATIAARVVLEEALEEIRRLAAQTADLEVAAAGEDRPGG
jgi:hypothetical protein